MQLDLEALSTIRSAHDWTQWHQREQDDLATLLFFQSNGTSHSGLFTYSQLEKAIAASSQTCHWNGHNFLLLPSDDLDFHLNGNRQIDQRVNDEKIDDQIIFERYRLPGHKPSPTLCFR